MISILANLYNILALISIPRRRPPSPTLDARRRENHGSRHSATIVECREQRRSQDIQVYSTCGRFHSEAGSGRCILGPHKFSQVAGEHWCRSIDHPLSDLDLAELGCPGAFRRIPHGCHPERLLARTTDPHVATHSFAFPRCSRWIHGLGRLPGAALPLSPGQAEPRPADSWWQRAQLHDQRLSRFLYIAFVLSWSIGSWHHSSFDHRGAVGWLAYGGERLWHLAGRACHVQRLLGAFSPRGCKVQRYLSSTVRMVTQS